MSLFSEFVREFVSYSKISVSQNTNDGSFDDNNRNNKGAESVVSALTTAHSNQENVGKMLVHGKTLKHLFDQVTCFKATSPFFDVTDPASIQKKKRKKCFPVDLNVEGPTVLKSNGASSHLFPTLQLPEEVKLFISQYPFIEEMIDKALEDNPTFKPKGMRESLEFLLKVADEKEASLGKRIVRIFKT